MIAPGFLLLKFEEQHHKIRRQSLPNCAVQPKINFPKQKLLQVLEINADPYPSDAGLRE